MTTEPKAEIRPADHAAAASPDPVCACANCDWRGDTGDADETRDFWSRVQPGDTVPAGDCPECGAFVFIETAPTRPSREDGRAVAILRALTIDLGDGPHDLVDEVNGLDVVKAAAARFLAEIGLAPVSPENLPDPDEEALPLVYERALDAAKAETTIRPAAQSAFVVRAEHWEVPGVHVTICPDRATAEAQALEEINALLKELRFEPLTAWDDDRCERALTAAITRRHDAEAARLAGVWIETAPVRQAEAAAAFQVATDRQTAAFWTWPEALAALYLATARACDAAGFNSIERCETFADLPTPGGPPCPVTLDIDGTAVTLTTA